MTSRSGVGRGGNRQSVDAFVAGLKRSGKSFDEGWIVERNVNISLMRDGNGFQIT